MMEKQLKNSSVAVVATTSYPKWSRGRLRSIKHTDKIRGDLAFEFIERVLTSGYRLVVADWRSSKTFRKALSTYKEALIIHRKTAKRSPSRRAAIKIASKLPEVKIIVLSEPEKVTLINSIPKITEPLLHDRAIVVIPKREDSLFKKSYPAYQYESESEGNKLYNQILRTYNLLSAKEQDLDLFFGPKAFVNSKEMVALFMKRFTISAKNISFPRDYFDPEEYSNAYYFPIVMTLKKKHSIASVTVPFEYPKLQKQNEINGSRELFVEKRKNQRLGLIVEVLEFLVAIQSKRGH